MGKEPEDENRKDKAKYKNALVSSYWRSIIKFVSQILLSVSVEYLVIRTEN